VRSDAHGVSGADLRWRVEHAQHIDPDDVQRFGRARRHRLHAGHALPPRTARGFPPGSARSGPPDFLPLAHLIDAGAVINNGTDVPVEPISAIASFTPGIADDEQR
jgi:predicted amidohydrolase YtcJ